MSRRSKETLAVQLFPFLAVLVCTMGSLIFLLLVITREIRMRAVAYAAFQQAQEEATSADPAPLPVLNISAPPPPDSITIETPVPVVIIQKEDDGYSAALAERERELSDLKATWRLKANLLSKDREQQLVILDRRKSLMETVKEKATSLQIQIKDLEAELGRLAGESAASSQTSNETERLLLEQQIAMMKKRLRLAQAADSTSKNDQFQVVPFDPQTGTSRRPIMIECTAAGLRFLPEDIMITAKDLEGFTHKANPLAAGTGALINYWTVWNMKQRQPHAEPEPYVLMLVRPDGVYAYYVAMKMLEPIRTSHGYELIEESTVLKLPEVDFGAKTACQTAVDRLIAEREKIYRAAVTSGSGNTVFGGTGSTRRGSGGIGKSFGPDRGQNSSDGSVTNRSGGGSFNLDDVTGGENAVGNRSWERIENFRGKQRGPRRGDGSGSVNHPPGEREPNGGEPDPANRVAAGTPTGAEPGSLENSQVMRNGKNAGAPSRISTNGTSSGGGTFDALPADSEPEPGMPIGKRPSRNKNDSSSGPGSDEVASTEDGDGEFDPDAEEAINGEPGGGGTSRSRTSDSPKTGLSDNGAAGRRFPHDPRNATRAPRPGERPSNKPDNRPDKPLEPEMLAGRRWGYCDPGASIGFEREVRVDVSAHKLVIAEKHVIPVGEGETKTETLERFASALDLCSREWGRPPQGFFWAPRLKFIVKPEGNAHYEQVNAMMTRAGLATSHEFSKDARSIEFGRANATTTRPAPKTATFPRVGGSQ